MPLKGQNLKSWQETFTFTSIAFYNINMNLITYTHFICQYRQHQFPHRLKYFLIKYEWWIILINNEIIDAGGKSLHRMSRHSKVDSRRVWVVFFFLISTVFIAFVFSMFCKSGHYKISNSVLSSLYRQKVWDHVNMVQWCIYMQEPISTQSLPHY